MSCVWCRCFYSVVLTVVGKRLQGNSGNFKYFLFFFIALSLLRSLFSVNLFRLFGKLSWRRERLKSMKDFISIYLVFWIILSSHLLWREQLHKGTTQLHRADSHWYKVHFLFAGFPLCTLHKLTVLEQLLKCSPRNDLQKYDISIHLTEQFSSEYLLITVYLHLMILNAWKNPITVVKDFLFYFLTTSSLKFDGLATCFSWAFTVMHQRSQIPPVNLVSTQPLEMKDKFVKQW